MITAYVFDNELLGDDGQDFDAALIEVKSFSTNSVAEDWFNNAYGYNDYSISYVSPTGEPLTDRVLLKNGEWD